MYKYIVYCSISAILIILGKYLYQSWMKQNHIVLELKNNIQLLENRVKTLESELEKKTISGGVKIPIVFRSIDKKEDPIEFIQNEEATIPIPTNINDTSSNGSKKSSKSESLKKSNSPKSKKNNMNIYLNDVDLEQMSDISALEKEMENISTLGATIAPEDTATDVTETTSKRKKKSNMPDAKSYNNGEKVTVDDVEYICVVGKRGGHSWKSVPSPSKEIAYDAI